MYNFKVVNAIARPQHSSAESAEAARFDHITHFTAGNGPWPEVAFVMFTMCSETYVPHWPNRSTYTPIPQARLDYLCYAECLGGEVNTGNGSWPEVAFVTFAMGSETCVSQPNRSTSTPANLTIHAMSSISGATSM